MKQRDQSLSLLALAIGLFLWPVLGWHIGIGVSLLGLAIIHGVLSIREKQVADVFLRQTQDLILQVVKSTTERETANIVRACLENALRRQLPPKDPGEKGH